jgi:hypothetical protein
MNHHTITAPDAELTALPMRVAELEQMLAEHEEDMIEAQVVLTGIRPEVAQTLVGLGADLSGKAPGWSR